MNNNKYIYYVRNASGSIMEFSKDFIVCSGRKLYNNGAKVVKVVKIESITDECKENCELIFYKKNKFGAFCCKSGMICSYILQRQIDKLKTELAEEKEKHNECKFDRNIAQLQAKQAVEKIDSSTSILAKITWGPYAGQTVKILQFTQNQMGTVAVCQDGVRIRAINTGELEIINNTSNGKM